MANKKKQSNTYQSRSGYFVKRVFAFGIDWYFSSILLNFLVRTVNIFFNIGDKYGNVTNYTPFTQSILIILSLFVALLYFVLVPHFSKTCGTVMMKVVGLEFVEDSGNRPSLKTLLVRFFIGSFIIQGSLYTSSNTIFQTITRSINLDKLKTLDYVIALPMTLIIGYSIYLALNDKKSSKTLQDKIAKTHVREFRR